jgi:hypothetical protein
VNPNNVTAKITPKSLTLSGTSANNKTYNGTTVATISSFGSLVGVVGSDDVSLNTTLSGSASFADANVGTGKTVTLLASSLGLTGTKSSNYQIVANTTTTANITAKALTVSSISANDKVYDATNVATLTGGTLNGVISGDSVSLVKSGTFTSLNVGSNIGVTVTGSLTGLSAGNYSLTSPVGLTASITPKALTMYGLSANDKAYDGNTTAVVTGTATLTGSVAVGAGNALDGKWYVGDSVSITGPPVGTFNSKNVAEASSVTYSGLSLSNSNYTLTIQSPSTAHITPKQVTLLASKTYDGTTDLTAAVTIGSTVGSEQLSYVGATANDVHVGTLSKFINAITLANGGTGATAGLAANYSLPALNAANAPVTINAKALTITGTSAVSDKIYDGTTTATVSGGTLSGAVSGDVLVLAQAGTFASANVGSTIAVTDASSFSVSTSTHSSATSDYTLPTLTGLHGNITPKTLTVTANNDAKFAGTSDTVGFAGVSYNGFVNGESASNLSAANFTAPSVTRTNASASNGNDAGTYTGVLVPTGGTASNYTFSRVNGNFTVVPADQLLVRLTPVTQTYGSTPTYVVQSAQYKWSTSSTVVDLLVPSVGSAVYDRNNRCDDSDRGYVQCDV